MSSFIASPVDPAFFKDISFICEDLVEEVLLFLRHIEDVNKEMMLVVVNKNHGLQTRCSSNESLVEPSGRIRSTFSGGVWYTSSKTLAIICSLGGGGTQHHDGCFAFFY